ncbi:MAG: hypothetical protein HOK57_03990 [Planctomycetaceae bacterium]|nr:hypothetical protein [Planctomycetaceae bacterium]MBT4159582.1 hypothetical protein [Planctomycetaceae bacterium]MBT6458964.1 hypothetical protein [Planctomycetaceae bacterium]MBT6642791.1 hypothetical protein [Planctomycetaceae bacterium]MBT6919535.1 hypothetical protein [Planctomycetaceae bacterium]
MASLKQQFVFIFFLFMGIIGTPNCLNAEEKIFNNNGYQWTVDHMQVGVRWQPFVGRPENNAYDAQRQIIARDSSYVQFWMAWSALEPTEANTDYLKQPSGYLQAIEQAVNACKDYEIKVEFVFFHCPAWASESGVSGGQRPKIGAFPAFVNRIAKHFKGRVDSYQLSHEVNNQGMMKGADVDFLIKEIFINGARAVRQVYEQDPKLPVLISTSGMSPCENCGQMKGLAAKGGRGVNELYDRYIASHDLMRGVDALNLNVSDQNDGYGGMDGSFVSSVWGNYELVRNKLDIAGYHHKSVLSAESWVSWDDGGSAVDVNGDGIKNEKDAFFRTLTIIGNCMERGLNTMQLPWSDNSSGWAMGLTKRRDYNGRIAKIAPELVIPASDGGPGIVTQKIGLAGNDEGFQIRPLEGNVFTVDDYINPPDPNHLHYYIWRWFSQIAAGPNEVIRHAVAGEVGNDIAVTGSGFTGNERYRIASYNRTEKSFRVLVYASGANGKTFTKVSIPSTIQTGRHSNTGKGLQDFCGEGFRSGEAYRVKIITKNISDEDGSDIHQATLNSETKIVEDGVLTATIVGARQFTLIDFIPVFQD